jgi:acyl dehydratase
VTSDTVGNGGPEFILFLGAMMEPSPLGHFFEDFEVGEVIRHSASKTILESDNNLFSLLTMNHHPVHLNHEYARSNQHQRVLVVGTLILSLTVGISVPDISGKAIANLGFESVEHLAPVFTGDTLYARSRILDKRESVTKPDRGVIYVETVAFKHDDVDVLRFRRKVLIKKRPDRE